MSSSGRELMLIDIIFFNYIEYYCIMCDIYLCQCNNQSIIIIIHHPSPIIIHHHHHHAPPPPSSSIITIHHHYPLWSIIMIHHHPSPLSTIIIIIHHFNGHRTQLVFSNPRLSPTLYNDIVWVVMWTCVENVVKIDYFTMKLWEYCAVL